MIRMQTHMGRVTLSDGYFRDLLTPAVASCYGVAGTFRRVGLPQIRVNWPLKIPQKPKDGEVPAQRTALVSVERREGRELPPVQVQRVYRSGKTVTAELRVAVQPGMRLNTVSASIANRVRWTIKNATGIQGVNVMIWAVR